MKTTLLTIAMFLACVINGLLLYEAFAVCPSNWVATGSDISITVPKSAADLPKIPEQQAVVDVVEQEQAGIVLIPYCDNRWAYHPGQPIRNTVRYFHNRQPVRNLLRGIFGRRGCYC